MICMSTFLWLNTKRCWCVLPVFGLKKMLKMKMDKLQIWLESAAGWLQSKTTTNATTVNPVGNINVSSVLRLKHFILNHWCPSLVDQNRFLPWSSGAVLLFSKGQSSHVTAAHASPSSLMVWLMKRDRHGVEHGDCSINILRMNRRSCVSLRLSVCLDVIYCTSL